MITYSISGHENEHTLIIKDSNNEIIIDCKLNLLIIDEVRELKDIMIKYLKNRGFD
ncbi:hypothetical protein LCGC14_0795860 [marine sediment metagenome]|uniref:Uncharacterized protein n=1 Tax=marine sediment metagenome TaxID=412755 RepID=A0A0F9QAZ0_9ZZZZ